MKKYIRAPAVRDRNKSDAYSSKWFTHPSKSPFPSYFSGLRLNFFNSSLRNSSPSPPRGSAPRPGGALPGSLLLNRKPEGSVVHGGLRLNSLILPLFFEEYLGVRLHACGHPRSARRRSNTAATSVTTVPLSVCYRALNFLVRVDASNFVPYACDRAVT